MFSYRHAFHAGNHADVFKHASLLAVLGHLLEKPAALLVVDTHAGAGLYRLDGEQARTSRESDDGLLRLNHTATAAGDRDPLLQTYLDTIAAFNRSGEPKVYPGSPFIIQRLLRQQDRLKLFELHPTDSRLLDGHVTQLRAGRQVSVLRQDGFEGLKAFLPPPSRRALVLIDPSYEIKSDYAKVADVIQDSLRRFATGTYFVWYPVIPRPEAHELPRRLGTLARQAGKPWLHATLSVGKSEAVEGTGGMNASGIFIVNPPHTLKAQLQRVLPELHHALKRGIGASWAVDSGS